MDFRKMRRLFASELTENVIPFWENFSMDRECGGYLTCLERDGKVYDTMKQMWMQWREVYMFAALYNSPFRKESMLSMAEQGFEFLLAHGKKPDGSWAYMLDRQGNVVQDKAGGSEVFTGSFAAVGCAELFRATGKKRYEEEAFHALDAYRTAVKTGTDRMEHLAHPMIELNVLQVMRRAFGDRVPAAELERCIEKIFRFRHPEYGIFLENAPVSGGFDLDSQAGRFTNPGHALEGLAFILEELRLRADLPFVRKYLLLTLQSIRDSFAYGWDSEQGGIWYFKDLQGRPVAKHEFMLKAWWPQNEAGTAVLRAFEFSRDPAFWKMFEQIREFSWAKLRDPDFPEWFAYAAVDGRQVHSYKGSYWKGFFHIPRHLLNCIEIFDRMENGK